MNNLGSAEPNGAESVFCFAKLVSFMPSILIGFADDCFAPYFFIASFVLSVTSFVLIVTLC